jgi:hypothetical protein
MKFSIRDVLWLTVVVALAVGWGIDRLSLHRTELRARHEADRALYNANLAKAIEEMRAAEMARTAEVLDAAP